MDKALLDTDIFSEVLKGVDERVLQRAHLYRASVGAFTVSSITVMEVIKGLHKQDREDRIRLFLSELNHVEILTVDREAAILAGRIYADLERIGRPIGRADPLIAAIAIVHDRVLVTGNVGHYERIRNQGYSLRLANWRVGAD